MTTDPDILVEARTALNDIVEQTPLAPEWHSLDAGLHHLDRGGPPRLLKGAVVGLVAAVAALVTIGAVALIGLSQDRQDIAGEVILQDGVVTEAEYHAAAEGVIGCLAEAGIAAELDFDDPNGHASFYLPQKEGIGLQYQEEMDRCLEAHLSRNVALGWAVTLGQIDLDELRDEESSLVGCVEQRTSQDFGDLTYDAFGYPTTQGQETRDAAFEYQDHEPWMACMNELGYLAESNAETAALVECVERKTGQDFGDVTFDESGLLTEEGEQTVRAAVTYQSDVPWNACQQELGLP